MEVVEGCDDVVRRGAVRLQAGEAELEDKGGFPKAGAFVHVFVKPFVASGEVEFMHEMREVRMQRAEKRHCALQELHRHEGMQGEGALEVVETVCQQGVEAIDGARGWLHW